MLKDYKVNVYLDVMNFFYAILATANLCAASELVVKTLHLPEQCDSKTERGSFIKIHYTVSIDESSETGEQGLKVDSTLDGAPYTFGLGVENVIDGWNKGLLNMCVGEKRELIVPPALAYGSDGLGERVPGGATLNFEVECVGISDMPDVFLQVDRDGSGTLTKEEVNTWFEMRGFDRIPNGLWYDNDMNKDGVISRNEFTGPNGVSMTGENFK